MITCSPVWLSMLFWFPTYREAERVRQRLQHLSWQNVSLSPMTDLKPHQELLSLSVLSPCRHLSFLLSFCCQEFFLFLRQLEIHDSITGFSLKNKCQLEFKRFQSSSILSFASLLFPLAIFSVSEDFPGFSFPLFLLKIWHPHFPTCLSFSLPLWFLLCQPDCFPACTQWPHLCLPSCWLRFDPSNGRHRHVEHGLTSLSCCALVSCMCSTCEWICLEAYGGSPISKRVSVGAAVMFIWVDQWLQPY